jgi:hypothetical protein
MKKKEYDLFRLQVRSDDKLVATFHGAEDDERTREVPADLQLSVDSRRVIELLIGMLNDASIQIRDLEDLGERLYAALFPDKIGALFEEKWQNVKNAENQTRGLRLSISIEKESEVLGWPLEFLKGPDQISWLAARRDLTLSRWVTFNKEYRSPKPAKRPLQVLIVVSKPQNLGSVMSADVIEQIGSWAASEENKDPEGNPTIQVTVLGILKDYREDIAGVKYLGEKATYKNFRKYTCDQETQPHILHFIGHGELREQEGSFLALVDEQDEAVWLSARVLAEMANDFNPRLVVLEACQTAQKDVAWETHRGFLSMAEYLVRNWIPAVVAMQFEIQNQYASEFAIGFYEALARGLEVDAAVQEGRSSILDSMLQWNERHFGAPVLYMMYSPLTPYVLVEDAEAEAASQQSNKLATTSPRPKKLKIPSEPGRGLPDVETLVQEEIGDLENFVKEGIWELAMESVQKTLGYLSSGDMAASHASLLQTFLTRASDRLQTIVQVESQGIETQVNELATLVLDDLDKCKKALIYYKKTTRGGTVLQTQTGLPVPGRGGPSPVQTVGPGDRLTPDQPQTGL